MQTFDNDEQGYLHWLSGNPGGFVVNTPKAGNDADYLHRATCSHISTSHTNYTTTTYKKLCSADKQELIDRERKQSRDLRNCSHCKP
jgi:hypothetical protein